MFGATDILRFGGVVFLSAFVSPSLAAASPVAKPDTPAGAIIYIRDVPNRQAQDPGQPGMPHFVNADQSALVIGSLGMGLTPLSDDAVAEVSAPSLSGQGSSTTTLISDDQASNPMARATGVLTASIGGHAPSAGGFAGQISSALGQALSIVPNVIPVGH